MRTIELPDKSPPIWGLMMQLDELPFGEALNRVAKISDLLLVTENFHRYRFGHGLVVSKVFQTFTKMLLSDRLSVVQRIGKLIDLALMCDKIKLNGAKDSIVGFFRQALAWPQEEEKQYCGVIYRRKHVKLLVPLIATEGLICDRRTKEEILCPLFPKDYVSKMLRRGEKCRLRVIEKRMSRRSTILQGFSPEEVNRRNIMLLRAYRYECRLEWTFLIGLDH
ncbi:unnamed protein product [Cylindrotheca closterium]|uniref:Uncharacterized protein n=1 Tax=Cylindrotheca closterium TaxID=2856 RepID=A0AAD2PUZ9_9STRA|nr:unnamed protein product [Cylindrotheca closterium]